MTPLSLSLSLPVSLSLSLSLFVRKTSHSEAVHLFCLKRKGIRFRNLLKSPIYMPLKSCKRKKNHKKTQMVDGYLPHADIFTPLDIYSTDLLNTTNTQDVFVDFY